jgi:ubiquinone/menaquinone biosynthesis C-methylase UbiE
VRFVQGDACAMPFGDGDFDVVMAVECVFHFPSRKRFFAEARRVLRAGGTLMVSDFVRGVGQLDELAAWNETRGSEVASFYGFASLAPLSETYARLARANGFAILANEDITAETLPTYASLRRLYRDAGLAGGVEATDYLDQASRRGFFEYHVLSFVAGS